MWILIKFRLNTVNIVVAILKNPIQLKAIFIHFKIFVCGYEIKFKFYTVNSVVAIFITFN